MPPKRRTPKTAPQPATALDARQRALRDEQEKLQRRMEKLKRLIEDAPKLAEAEQKRRREELVSRSMERTRRVDAPTRLDTRYAASVADAAPPSRNRRKALRTQQRQARLIFFGLLFALIILVLWLWSVWKW